MGIPFSVAAVRAAGAEQLQFITPDGDVGIMCRQAHSGSDNFWWGQSGRSPACGGQCRSGTSAAQSATPSDSRSNPQEGQHSKDGKSYCPSLDAHGVISGKNPCRNSSLGCQHLLSNACRADCSLPKLEEDTMLWCKLSYPAIFSRRHRVPAALQFRPATRLLQPAAWRRRHSGN